MISHQIHHIISNQKTIKLQNEINITVSVEASSHIYFLNDTHPDILHFTDHDVFLAKKKINVCEND